MYHKSEQSKKNIMDGNNMIKKILLTPKLSKEKFYG